MENDEHFSKILNIFVAASIVSDLILELEEEEEAASEELFNINNKVIERSGVIWKKGDDVSSEDMGDFIALSAELSNVLLDELNVSEDLSSNEALVKFQKCLMLAVWDLFPNAAVIPEGFSADEVFSMIADNRKGLENIIKSMNGEPLDL